MPIRDYKCKDCGHEFEYQSFRSDDKPSCPKCKAAEDKLETKVATNTGFALKGKGWYRDGY